MMGFPTETLTLLKGDGTRHTFEGLVDIKSIHTNDIKIPYEMDDEIERKLPNGMAEVFVIENPAFFQGHGGIDDFYDLKVARRGSRKPTPVTNILHVGSMHGSQIQQGSHGSSQTGTFNLGTDHAGLLDVLAKIRTDLPKLPPESKEEAEVYVEAVEKQTKLTKPNAGFIRSSLESLKSVLEGSAAKVITATSTSALKAWLNAHGIPTG